MVVFCRNGKRFVPKNKYKSQVVTKSSVERHIDKYQIVGIFWIRTWLFYVEVRKKHVEKNGWSNEIKIFFFIFSLILFVSYCSRRCSIVIAQCSRSGTTGSLVTTFQKQLPSHVGPQESSQHF